jgi:FkbM family methyltransferase
VVCTEVGELVLPLRDPGSSDLLFFGKILHEQNETLLIRRLAKTAEVVIDVGAHFGWYSLLMWRAMQGGRRVLAFEPNPITYAYLLENARNCDGLSTYQRAVGDIEGPIPFHVALSSNLSSSVRSVGQEISVGSTTLDSIAQEARIWGAIDFVKCDVEGGELAVLRGSRIVRSAESPPIWMIEIDPVFLREANITADDLNSEILGIRPSSRLFYLGQDGCPVEIPGIPESGKTLNIFIVPTSRLEQFWEVASSVGTVS